MNKILITGCNGNLSLTLIEYFLSKQDYIIIGCDLHDKFDPKNKINKKNITYIKSDLQSLSSIKDMFVILKNNNLLPDLIINNAAVDSVPIANVKSDGLDLNDFDSFFRINVRGPIYLFKLISKEWIKMKMTGSVINLSTIYSKLSPDPNLYSKGFIKNILYGSSKSALNNAFKQISVIYARKNIRVNTLILAGVESTQQSKEFKDKYQNRIPLGRFLKIKEIYSAFDFLLDDRNSYMTGSEIIIDGGYTLI
ncbi:SDR family oxidoreductase [Flavobacteriaceae bacterium]|nr:SDR family oxidoreductase [Flavobacteriaceae bacterium]